MIPVITIDGPSGAGKGTICQLLAKKLGYSLLDSGALYRLTALAGQLKGADLADPEAMGKIAENLAVAFNVTDTGVVTLLDGEDVSQAIRQEQVGMDASKVAAYPQVRSGLLSCQRQFAKLPGLVADGRDMGTTVFPDAPVKIFLTASAEERARRRVLQLEEKGEDADIATILADIELRDKRDRERKESPLVPAADALELDSTSLSIEQVLEKVLGIVGDKLV
jgi:cytidylate kinase